MTPEITALRFSQQVLTSEWHRKKYPESIVYANPITERKRIIEYVVAILIDRDTIASTQAINEILHSTTLWTDSKIIQTGNIKLKQDRIIKRVKILHKEIST